MVDESYQKYDAVCDEVLEILEGDDPLRSILNKHGCIFDLKMYCQGALNGNPNQDFLDRVISHIPQVTTDLFKDIDMRTLAKGYEFQEDPVPWFSSSISEFIPCFIIEELDTISWIEELDANTDCKEALSIINNHLSIALTQAIVPESQLCTYLESAQK